MKVIKKQINYKRLRNTNCTFEHIIIKIRDGPTTIDAYNPPNHNMAAHDLDALVNTDKVLLIGYLNAKQNTWNCNRHNRNGLRLRDYVDNNSLQKYNTDPATHFHDNGMSPTTIDFIITKKTP